MSFLRFFGGGAGTQATSSGHFGAGSSHSSGVLEKAEDNGSPLPPNPDSKQFGMENFGNTCYANSVLQALYFCQPFRDLICMTPDRFREEFPHPAPPPPASVTVKQTSSTPCASSEAAQQPPATTSLTTPPTLFSALRSLYLHISTHPSVRGVVSPTSFINKLKKENELFRGPMHQDAHEFLNFLLNKIVEDLQTEKHARAADVSDKAHGGQDIDPLSNSVGSLTSTSTAANGRTERSGSLPDHNGLSSNPTLVQTLFEGVLTNETRCLTCETVSSRDESFLDLSIDIEQNSSVTACLRQFSASEMLCQKNKFFCDSCCSLQEAEKRMKIKILPNVLALHLKRFKPLPAEDKYVKLAYRVAFPLELRLFNTVDDAEDPDRLYHLFAIIVHIGGGPHHGHYITIVKSFGSVWRVFDDVNVYSIPESDIPRYFGDSSAGVGYVLFYQAVDLIPETVGLPSKPILADRVNITSSPGNAQPIRLNHDSAVTTSSPHREAAAGANGHSLYDFTASPSPAPTKLPTPVARPPPSASGSSIHPPPMTGGRVSPQTLESAAGIDGNHQRTSIPPSHILSASTLGTGSATASIPTPVSSSSFTNALFGKIGRPPSGVFSHRPSPAPSSQHLQAPGESSHAASNPAHVTHGGNEKENRSGGGWFSRPKRKESLHAPIPVLSFSLPHSDADRSNTSLPEIKPRSSRRPQAVDKIITSGIGDAASAEELRQSPIESKPSHLQRPRTAPGSSVPSSPSSPSMANSFDKSCQSGDQSMASVPPLPDMSTTSLASSAIAPPSSASPSSHQRRKSLSKHAGNFFSRPRSGYDDNLGAPLLSPSPGFAGSQPPSPVVQPTPPARHPRRVASILHISSQPPPPTTSPSRSRSPSSMEQFASTALPIPESMVALSASAPSPILNHPVTPTSTSTAAQQNSSTQHVPPSATTLRAPPAVTDSPTHGVKRASRKMSLSGKGSFWGGWGSKDKDHEKDKDISHQPNGKDREKLHRDNTLHAHPSTGPQPQVVSNGSPFSSL